jgi:hypothetical protein
MRRGGAVLCWALLLVIVAGWPTCAGTRIRVGVLEFTGATSRHERQTASNRLAQVLVDLGRFDVIERERLDQIMREQRFQQSYPVDQDTAVEMGRIAGIGVIFTGHIDHLDSKWTRPSGAAGYYAATARIGIKVIDVQSGRLIKVLSTSGSGTGDRPDEAENQALGACFGTDLVGQLRGAFSLQSQVVEVDGNVVYLQLGREAGVRVGQRYTLFRPEGDGWTTDGSGQFTKEIGLVQISSVTLDTAKGRVLWSTTPPEVGDVLMEMAEPRTWVIGLDLQAAELRLSGPPTMPLQGVVGVWHWRIGKELALRSEGGFEFVLATPLGNVSWAGFGGYGSLEMPLIPAMLDATLQGAVGLAVATQPYSGYPGLPWTIASSGTATGASFYLRGDAGLKMYLTPKRGLRLEAGTCFYGGPIITEWSVRPDGKPAYNVTNYVQYPDFRVGGVSLRGGVAYAF